MRKYSEMLHRDLMHILLAGFNGLEIEMIGVTFKGSELVGF